LEIERFDSGVENLTPKGNYLQHVVGNVIGSLPAFLEVHVTCWFMALRGMLLQGSISLNAFNFIRNQVDIRNVEFSISLIGKLYLMADIKPICLQFAQLF
jgi:hypothetical protein